MKKRKRRRQRSRHSGAEPTLAGSRTSELGLHNSKVMILMRGLPSSGKSHTSRELLAEGGVRLEFDEFFYSQVGHNPAEYNWSRDLLPKARQWNLRRIVGAIDTEKTPIIVDSDNNIGSFTKQYVAYAVDRGYDIQFKEPESAWWRSIRELLQDRARNKRALQRWAKRLAAMSSRMHRVPIEDFLHRIDRWEDVTLDRIIEAA